MHQPIPTKKQLDFLSWQYGVFFHFGIRSCYRGSQDWDMKKMDPAAFNPTQLDMDSWMTDIKQAGARYAVLTAKHHDGFALWPSQYTDYSVKATPWKAGQGDVVREFVDACRRHEIKVGLYYSPAQWGAGPAFQPGKAYDDYFIAQLGELLTNYGAIDYLWFDGAGSEGHTYDKRRIVAAIRQLQPDILLFNLWDPDTLWAGNEAGYAPLDNFNSRQGLKAEQLLTAEDDPQALKFLPLECDTKLRSTWFDCEDNLHTLRTLPELLGIWVHSVGRGANLLLNIGPEASGLLPQADRARLLELGAAVRRQYGTPLADFALTRTQDCLCLQSPAPQLLDRVVLTEDLTQGQQVRGFSLYMEAPVGPPILVYQGQAIGAMHICVLPALSTHRLTLVCEPKGSEEYVTSMRAYCAEC